MNAHRYPRFPVLIVDDEEDVLHSYRMTLRYNRINNLALCHDSREVYGLLEKERFSALVLDLAMPHIPGREILAHVRERYPELPVIVVTGSNNVSTAVDCMKQGALDYMVKPVEDSRLVSGLRNALQIGELRDENTRLRKQVLSGELEHRDAFSSFVTVSESMKAVFSYIEAIAASPRPVLITGESGVGKELVARALHDAGERDGQFVAVNVAGLDDTVFSDTLFGHRKGAFTGADVPRPGLVEQAGGGTLFLDEIGSLENSSQVKLLRLLQENEYYPLGSDVHRIANTVVVAATNEDLHRLMEAGVFRRDLYFRLNTHHIHVPPLRDRPEDISYLAEHFVAEAARSLGKSRPRITSEAMTLLIGHTYPGNARELQSLLFDAVSRCTTGAIAASDIERHLATEAPRSSSATTLSNGSRIALDGGFPKLRAVEEFLVEEAMRRASGNQTVAARLLGVAQSTLSRRFRAKSSQ
ncbi:MAG: response regulator [Chitinivibrionales bacterium]|nr:response regulator [Chitinivibrionales bacterium]